MVDVIAAYNRVLGNPARNTYNNAVTDAKRLEDTRVAAANAAGGTEVPNYDLSHVAGLAAIQSAGFSRRGIRGAAYLAAVDPAQAIGDDHLVVCDPG